MVASGFRAYLPRAKRVAMQRPAQTGMARMSAAAALLVLWLAPFAALGCEAAAALQTASAPSFLQRGLTVASRSPLPGPEGALAARLRGGAELVKCEVEVQVVGAQHGDQVLMVGSGQRFREWDMDSAIALRRDGNPMRRGWWSAEVSLPIGDTVEYKFVLRRRSGLLEWEEGPNRQMVVPDALSHSLSCRYAELAPPPPPAPIAPRQQARRRRSLLSMLFGCQGATDPYLCCKLCAMDAARMHSISSKANEGDPVHVPEEKLVERVVSTILSQRPSRPDTTEEPVAFKVVSSRVTSSVWACDTGNEDELGAFGQPIRRSMTPAWVRELGASDEEVQNTDVKTLSEDIAKAYAPPASQDTTAMSALEAGEEMRVAIASQALKQLRAGEQLAGWVTASAAREEAAGRPGRRMLGESMARLGERKLKLFKVEGSRVAEVTKSPSLPAPQWPVGVRREPASTMAAGRRGCRDCASPIVASHSPHSDGCEVATAVVVSAAAACAVATRNPATASALGSLVTGAMERATLAAAVTAQKLRLAASIRLFTRRLRAMTVLARPMPVLTQLEGSSFVRDLLAESVVKSLKVASNGVQHASLRVRAYAMESLQSGRSGLDEAALLCRQKGGAVGSSLARKLSQGMRAGAGAIENAALVSSAGIQSAARDISAKTTLLHTSVVSPAVAKAAGSTRRFAGKAVARASDGLSSLFGKAKGSFRMVMHKSRSVADLAGRESGSTKWWQGIVERLKMTVRRDKVPAEPDVSVLRKKLHDSFQKRLDNVKSKLKSGRRNGATRMPSRAHLSTDTVRGNGKNNIAPGPGEDFFLRRLTDRATRTLTTTMSGAARALRGLRGGSQVTTREHAGRDARRVIITQASRTVNDTPRAP